MKKKTLKTLKKYKPTLIGLGFCALAALAVGISGIIHIDTPKFKAEIKYSGENIPALIQDMGEVKEIDGEEIPTVESVDGGMFEDIANGVSVTTGDYKDLGWSEWYDTSSPEAFKNDTLGKCIVGNNIYGAQCVSLARVFWWSYADRDVSTCGTGMAKGMMNCAEENAGDDFLVYWRNDAWQIQAGDWLVFDGGLYGHIGMALGNVNGNYVALLGENQGGRECYGGGAATNIINISLNDLIGFYRPKAYVKPSPSPEPQPIIPDKCDIREVVWGDTLSKIMYECKGYINWQEMNDYARAWKSNRVKLYNTVYDGWISEQGVGLFAGDQIIYQP